MTILFVFILIFNDIQLSETTIDKKNNSLIMNECCKIIFLKDVEEYLKEQGRTLFDIDSQIPTNKACIYVLNDKKIVVYLLGAKKGLLVSNQVCLDNLIKNDDFPIYDEGNKLCYDYEVEKVKNIHNNINYYFNLLNNHFNSNFTEINEQSLKSFFLSARNERLKKDLDNLSQNALIAVLGEFVRVKTNGKWVLLKRYSGYNPSYEPMIVTEKGHIRSLELYVSQFLERKSYKIDDFINGSLSVLTFTNIDNAIARGMNYIKIQE